MTVSNTPQNSSSFASAPVVTGTAPSSITAKELYALLATPDAPIVIDVCIDEDFAADPRLIPSARRFPFGQIAQFRPRMNERPVIVVCQKGLKLSQGAAALLRTMGVDAAHLEGGNVTWRDQGLPLMGVELTCSSRPALAFGEPSVWVAPHTSTLATLSGCWLVCRYFDPDARFLFVDPEMVPAVCDKFQGIPLFDRKKPEVGLAQTLERFGTSDPAIKVFDTLVAERNGHLQCLFAGLSHSVRDDLTRLCALLPVFDALTSWARTITGQPDASIDERNARK